MMSGTRFLQKNSNTTAISLLVRIHSRDPGRTSKIYDVLPSPNHFLTNPNILLIIPVASCCAFLRIFAPVRVVPRRFRVIPAFLAPFPPISLPFPPSSNSIQAIFQLFILHRTPVLLRPATCHCCGQSSVSLESEEWSVFLVLLTVWRFISVYTHCAVGIVR